MNIGHEINIGHKIVQRTLVEGIWQNSNMFCLSVSFYMASTQAKVQWSGVGRVLILIVSTHGHGQCDLRTTSQGKSGKSHSF
jgi:hypothetical protein